MLISNPDRIVDCSYGVITSTNIRYLIKNIGVNCFYSIDIGSTYTKKLYVASYLGYYFGSAPIRSLFYPGYYVV